MKLWVPCRAINKKYDAGKFGNTIVGGITNGETPLKTILTEAEEGLALSRDFIREHQGNGHPALFQLVFPRGRTPEAVSSVNFRAGAATRHVAQPDDGEVHEFPRIDAQEMKEAVMAGEMTDDAAIVWLGFLVRHGIVGEQSEPDLPRIIGRMHRHLPVPFGPA